MTNDFDIVRTIEGKKLDRSLVEDKNIVIVRGLCIADPNNISRPREFEWYLENILNPLIKDGKISDGSNSPFDDRKVRLDKVSINGNNLEISLGATHFLENKEPYKRTDKENLYLQELSKNVFNDEYSFFPRACGVAAAVITSERSIFLGERVNTNEDRGYLNAVAGYINFREDPTTVNLEDELLREMNEEFGIEKKSIRNMKFVGVYHNPIRSDLDFTHIVFTDLPDSYFASGLWKERSKDKEHSNLVKLNNYSDINSLLQQGIIDGDNRRWSLMYSTRGALMSIKPKEVKN